MPLYSRFERPPQRGSVSYLLTLLVYHREEALSSTFFNFFQVFLSADLALASSLGTLLVYHFWS